MYLIKEMACDFLLLLNDHNLDFLIDKINKLKTTTKSYFSATKIIF